jgi:ribonuclease HI
MFLEKQCLSLYYACSKFRHYVLASRCTVVCQYHVVRYMLNKPILSSRLGKWAYSLIEYDLAFEPLRAKKSQVVADFIIDHMIAPDVVACLVEPLPWKLFFHGSVCNQGQVVGCVIVSLSNSCSDVSARLEFACTNNQTEYEALLHGLELLRDMGVRNVEAFGESMLIVQQIKGESQCLDGALNRYCEECVGIIKSLESLSINHILRGENERANMLAQQALGYNITKGMFSIKGRPMLSNMHAHDDMDRPVKKSHSRARRQRRDRLPGKRVGRDRLWRICITGWWHCGTCTRHEREWQRHKSKGASIEIYMGTQRYNG